MTITIRESGLPRLRRTFWIEGDGAQLLGLRGLAQGLARALSQVSAISFDVWQLQNWLRVAGYDVPLTGTWNIEGLIALSSIAGAWDQTFSVEEPEGAERITIHVGSKPGISRENTLAAWTEFAATIAASAKRPQPEPPPALAPVAIQPPLPPAQILIPADAEPIRAADVGISLKAAGFYAGSLARPGGSKDIKWSEVMPAWTAWTQARGITVKIFRDPDEPADEPDTSRLVSPGTAYDRLYQEAAQRPEALKAARIEADVEIAEPGDVPAPVPARKSIWPALIVGGIVVGGTWALWRGRRS